MSGRLATALMGLAMSVLMAPATGLCQRGENRTPVDPLATLRVGHWVQLEGNVQGEHSVRCTGVRPLVGDFLDGDWSVIGVIQAIDPEKREFSIGGCRIQVTENTSFEHPRVGFRSFSDLHPGMLLDIEGTYLKDRRLLALEMDDEADEIPHSKWSKDWIRIVGKIEHLDSRRRLITAMGTVFHVTEKTQLRSAIR